MDADGLAATDFYRMDDLLTDAEREVRDRVRTFCDKEVTPIINDYWERADFPFELVPKLASLGIAGGSIQGYGCPGLSPVAVGLVGAELARGDGSVCTFFGVHSGLAMSSVAMLGSEEQKRRWLPAMARMEKIGAFGLTEPRHGSDAVALETRARRDGDENVLDGAKRLHQGLTRRRPGDQLVPQVSRRPGPRACWGGCCSGTGRCPAGRTRGRTRPLGRCSFPRSGCWR